MTYNIEKNVPIPVKMRGMRSELTLTLSKMEPGDCVLFHDVKANTLRARIHDFKRRNDKRDWQFIIQSEGEGSRCWRVEDKSE